MPLNPSTIPKSAPKAPELVPVFFINLKLQDPNSVLENQSYAHSVTLVNIVDGEITTVPNKLNLELDANSLVGIDHITADTKVGVNKLDCYVYGKTPSGAGLHIHYFGLIKGNEAVGKVLGGGKSIETDFTQDYVTSNPVILFDGEVEEKYLWAKKENLIGKGRFLRDEAGALHVQYYVYVLN